MDLLRMESFPSSVNQRISSAISMELLRMESCGGRNSFPTPGCGLHRSAQICKFSTSHQTANIHSTSRQPFASTRFAEEDFVYGVAETSSRNHHKTKAYCHQRLVQIVSTLSGSRPGHPDCPACKFSQPCPAQLRQQTQRNSARKLGQPSQAR